MTGGQCLTGAKPIYTNLHATLASCASWLTVNSLQPSEDCFSFVQPSILPPDSTLCRLGDPCQWHIQNMNEGVAMLHSF